VTNVGGINHSVFRSKILVSLNCLRRRNGHARLREVEIGQANGLEAESVARPEPGEHLVLYRSACIEGCVGVT